MSAGGRSGKHGGRRWRPRRRAGEAGDTARAEPESGPLPAGAARIRDCAEGPGGRPVVRVMGTLRAVHERSVAGMPALRAELDDGSASLEVIWLGQRAIAGIEPGRTLIASGRIAMTHGRPVLFNPRYQLRPREQD
jgi:hypothetical protein